MLTTYNIYLKLKLTKLKIFLQEIRIQHLKTKFNYIKQIYTQFEGRNKKLLVIFFLFLFSTLTQNL